LRLRIDGAGTAPREFDQLAAGGPHRRGLTVQKKKTSAPEFHFVRIALGDENRNEKVLTLLFNSWQDDPVQPNS
jgi:hypothetical protein